MHAEPHAKLPLLSPRHLPPGLSGQLQVNALEKSALTDVPGVIYVFAFHVSFGATDF